MAEKKRFTDRLYDGSAIVAAMERHGITLEAMRAETQLTKPTLISVRRGASKNMEHVARVCQAARLKLRDVVLV